MLWQFVASNSGLTFEGWDFHTRLLKFCFTNNREVQHSSSLLCIGNNFQHFSEHTIVPFHPQLNFLPISLNGWEQSSFPLSVAQVNSYHLILYFLIILHIPKILIFCNMIWKLEIDTIKSWLMELKLFLQVFNMGLTGCYAVLKYIVFLLNLVFWVCLISKLFLLSVIWISFCPNAPIYLIFQVTGLTVIFLSVWMLFDPTFYISMAQDESSYYSGVCILFLAGTLLFVVGFLGCFGAYKESPKLLILVSFNFKMKDFENFSTSIFSVVFLL